MYCGKLLNFLSFNSTSFLSSSTGSKEKKSVGGKLCVEDVWVCAGHSAASELPAPDLVLCSLFAAGPRARQRAPWVAVRMT